MTIETILNSNMSVAYITDCATSPVTIFRREKNIFLSVPAEIRTAYPSSCQLKPQQHKFTHKYGEAFYWVEQQHGFA